MPRRCTVCDHGQREMIDTALMENSPFRDIARQWRVSKDAVARHKSEHIPAHLAKAEEAKEVTKADDLLGRLLHLNRETMSILQEARSGGDNEIALKAITRAEKQIELQARLLGELKETTVNVLISPQWHELRAVLVNALMPYPQARIAVTEALGRLNAGA